MPLRKSIEGHWSPLSSPLSLTTYRRTPIGAPLVRRRDRRPPSHRHRIDNLSPHLLQDKFTANVVWCSRFQTSLRRTNVTLESRRCIQCVVMPTFDVWTCWKLHLSPYMCRVICPLSFINLTQNRPV